jgi:uncharacterized protein YjbJ (UPF0337 family)
MNKMIMKGKWHQVKGSVKEQWGRLTDDDIKMFLGEGEQLVGRLQERYGYTQEQAEREVAEFLDSLSENLTFTEARDRSAQVVRQHPWLAGVFLGSIALLVVGYMLNRFFSVVEVQEDIEHSTV